jgi:hypothetical protein
MTGVLIVFALTQIENVQNNPKENEIYEEL